MLWLVLTVLALAAPPAGSEELAAFYAAMEAGDEARATSYLRDAREQLEGAVTEAPESADAWHMLAQAAYWQREDARAEEAWRRALALQPTHGDAMYRLAMLLGERGDHAGSAVVWGRLAAAEPDREVALWNQGQELQIAGDAAGARAVFERVAVTHPEDWKALAKIVQLTQAQGDLVARDATIARLRELRASGTLSSLRDASLYVRDQFDRAGRHVLVLEYFELRPDQPKIYVFVMQDPGSGEEVSRLTFGSMELDTQIARELREIDPDERSYYLDADWPGGHANFGMWRKRLSYDEVRAVALRIIDGEVSPASMVLPTSATPEAAPPRPAKKGRKERR